jgi:hypothetical protein
LTLKKLTKYLWRLLSELEIGTGHQVLVGAYNDFRRDLESVGNNTMISRGYHAKAQIPKRGCDNRHLGSGKCISNPLASSLEQSSIIL